MSPSQQTNSLLLQKRIVKGRNGQRTLAHSVQFVNTFVKGEHLFFDPCQIAGSVALIRKE